MIEAAATTPPPTAFETIWQQPDGHLFKSTRHGVMAIVDVYPRMPLQVVVAPRSGNSGGIAHFYDLDLPQQRKLLEVGLMVGAKILQHCSEEQRSMFTLEGFAVKDHPHIVYYAGIRSQGVDRYTGACLDEAAVQQTRDAISFSRHDTEALELRLDAIR